MKFKAIYKFNGKEIEFGHFVIDSNEVVREGRDGYASYSFRRFSQYIDAFYHPIVVVVSKDEPADHDDVLEVGQWTNPRGPNTLYCNKITDFGENIKQYRKFGITLQELGNAVIKLGGTIDQIREEVRELKWAESRLQGTLTTL